METIFTDINYLAILVALVVNQAIGAIWYNPSVLGTTWAKLSGIDFNSIDKSDATKSMIYSGLLALIMMFVLAILIQLLKPSTFIGGVGCALILWSVATLQMAINMIYESKPIKLFFINSAYPLISLSIAGGIFAVW